MVAAAGWLVQILAAGTFVWSWEAGFGGADAPWSEASSHALSNAALAVSAAGTLLNAAAIYLAATWLRVVVAAPVGLAMIPPCIVSTASIYGLLIVTGLA